MSYIDDLQRDLRSQPVLDVFFGGYEEPTAFDREAPTQQDLQRLAYYIDNRVLRDDPVKIEYHWSFPEAWAWTDQRSIVHDVDELEWSVPVQGYSAGVAYKRTNINRPSAKLSLPRVVDGLGPELWRLQMRKFFWTLAQNPLTADGANLYSAAHKAPGGGTYDNILSIGDYFPGTLSDATHDHAKAFLQAARNRISSNLQVRHDVRKRGKKRTVAVICRDSHLADLFDDLAHESQLTLDSKFQANPEAGTFEIYETGPAKTATDLIQVIDLESNQQLPIVFWVLDMDPSPPEARAPKQKRDDMCTIEADIQFGMKAGFGFAIVNGSSA